MGRVYAMVSHRWLWNCQTRNQHIEFHRETYMTLRVQKGVISSIEQRIPISQQCLFQVNSEGKPRAHPARKT